MRASTILLTASLLLAALATPAQADPTGSAPDCPPFHAETFLGGVAVDEDCNVHQPVTPRCPYLHVDTVFGPFFLNNDCTVTYHPLGAVDAIAIDPRAAPDCPAKVYDNGQQRVEVQRDCDVYVKLIDCITGGIYEEYAAAGPVTLYTYRCTFGPPPATEDHEGPGETARQAVEDLQESIGQPDVPSLRDEACRHMMGQEDCGAPRGGPRPVYVDLPKTYDCVWGGSWVTIFQVGPVHVREYQCTEPVESRAADPFPTCVTEPCGPVPYPPSVPGVPLVGDSCNSFHVDGTVTYYQYNDCGARVTALGNEFCYDGAGCQDPCSLPDVGRTGAGLFWNDDCSADPHLDTSGSCLGGGGKDVRVLQRGNVNVVVTVCDRPGPDPTTSGTQAKPCNGPFYQEWTVRPVTVYFGGGVDCSGVRIDDGDAPESPVESLRDMVCDQMMGQGDCGGAPP